MSAITIKESQHTEWKESWRDDHLRWVCGFANADGGVLVIGRNDRGQIIGIPDAKKLLEDLPNKIRDLLGILVAVNLHEAGGKEYLELVTPAYPSPISYRGHYYQRSGSTLQELKGAALDRFLLRRYGRTWDSVPVPGPVVADLSRQAIQAFRTLAAGSGRMEAAALNASDAGLVAKLKLKEGKYLTRAAVLLFHPDPQRYVTGAFTKIGFFRSESDLVYHDVVEGDLFNQVRQTMDLLLTKYLKASIRYESTHRIERFPMPRAALREALLNALTHRDYSTPAPVQIRVYDDKLKIWNPAVLPEGWSLQDLLGEHSSMPFNPLVANTFFRAGEIEAWGRGIERIFEACRAADTPEPQWRWTNNDLWMEFPFSAEYMEAIGSGNPDRKTSSKTSVEASGKTSGKTSVKILDLLRRNPAMTLAEVAVEVDRSVRAVEMASAKLVQQGKLRRVGPSKGGHWEVAP